MKIFVMDRLGNDINGNARYLIRGWDKSGWDMTRYNMEAYFHGLGRWNEKRWGLVVKLEPHAIRDMLQDGDILLEG